MGYSVFVSYSIQNTLKVSSLDKASVLQSTHFWSAPTVVTTFGSFYHIPEQASLLRSKCIGLKINLKWVYIYHTCVFCINFNVKRTTRKSVVVSYLKTGFPSLRIYTTWLSANSSYSESIPLVYLKSTWNQNVQPI